MTVVVLDSNALPRGHFSVRALRQWIEVAGKDADIVIPEVVIWEWAEHAASAYTTLQSQLREFRVDPGLYERPTIAEQIPIESLVDRMKDTVPKSIQIWSPPDSTWKQGVIDQVLQIGSGERKAGVKTGAADSVVLACVTQQVDSRRNAEAVILATSDKNLKRNCARLFGEEVLTAENAVALLQRLNAFEPAEDELFEETEEILSRLVTDTSSEIGAALETFDMGWRIHPGEESPDPPDTPFYDLARLGRVEIVELHRLQVATQDGNRRVGLAGIRVFADIHMTRFERDTTASTSGWIATFDGPISHGFVDFVVAVNWDTHWKVESVSPRGEAVIVFDSSEYDELDDVPPFHAGPLTLD